MSRPPRFLVVVSALYGLALGIIALWPTHIDSAFTVNNSFVGRWLIGAGLTGGQSYRLIEFTSNVIMYAPLGVIVMVLAPTLRWWRVCVLALLLSGTFELLQAFFRPGRTADVSDVVANTLGAALGAGCVVVLRAIRRSGRGRHAAERVGQRRTNLFARERSDRERSEANPAPPWSTKR